MASRHQFKYNQYVYKLLSKCLKVITNIYLIHLEKSTTAEEKFDKIKNAFVCFEVDIEELYFDMIHYHYFESKISQENKPHLKLTIYHLNMRFHVLLN